MHHTYFPSTFSKKILIHFILSHSSIFLFSFFFLYKYYGSSSSTSQPEVEKDANKASSKKEEDEKKTSSEKEEETKKGAIALVDVAGAYIKNRMTEFKWQDRLPKFPVPIRYNIRLKPDLNACKFAGSVAIELNIEADTSYIVLNAAELSVDTASVSFAHSSNSKVRIRISYRFFFYF